MQKDEIDAEMKEYEKKMEEQKRLREKIIQEKENRRKLAAIEKKTENIDQKKMGKMEFFIDRYKIVDMVRM